jgi:hypothetical protein
MEDVKKIILGDDDCLIFDTRFFRMALCKPTTVASSDGSPTRPTRSPPERLNLPFAMTHPQFRYD